MNFTKNTASYFNFHTTWCSEPYSRNCFTEPSVRSAANQLSSDANWSAREIHKMYMTDVCKNFRYLEAGQIQDLASCRLPYMDGFRISCAIQKEEYQTTQIFFYIIIHIFFFTTTSFYSREIKLKVKGSMPYLQYLCVWEQRDSLLYAWLKDVQWRQKQSHSNTFCMFYWLTGTAYPVTVKGSLHKHKQRV